MTSPSRIIRNVERLHVGLAVAGCAAATAVGTAALTGALVGVAIGGINFRLGAGLTRRLTGGGGHSKISAIFLLVGKLALLVVAIGAAMRWLQPEPIALLLGLSLAPLSLMVVTALGAQHAGAELPTGSAGPTAPTGGSTVPEGSR